MNQRGELTLILGLGESGLAAAKWLSREGARLRIADSRPQPPNMDGIIAVAPAAEIVCGGFNEALLDGVGRIVLSPGVPLATPLVQTALAKGIPVVSEIQLFVDALRSLDAQAKVLAITGSNGKTTTTALTAALASAAGFPAVACGNISPSALDALMAALDAGALPAVWVLELSSFQLETTHTLGADAATLLNVSEDHLDRHEGMDGYTAAKTRIFQGGPDGRRPLPVLNRDDARSLSAARCGQTFVTFGLDAPARARDYGLIGNAIARGGEVLIGLDQLRLAGRHNAANAMAALALCEAIGIAPQAALAGLAAFDGLPHRVQPVAEIAGVIYYDDSKGTNVGATLAAITGLDRSLAIILGGDGKGQDFAPLAAALRDDARAPASTRAIALIGRDAERIAAELDAAGVSAPRQRCADMAEAVRFCAAHTRAGDAVLLSPACASLDMYRNYAHRAEAFILAAHALAAGAL